MSVWKAAAVAALGLLGTGSFAQVGDYPNLGGGSARNGQNGAPLTNGPGRAVLRWFSPRGAINNPRTILLDNTDFASTAGFQYWDGSIIGPFDPPVGGFVTSTSGWIAPREEQEAAFPFLLSRRRTTSPVNFNSRWPGYYYTRTAASAPGTDPRVANNAVALRTFEWRIQPTDPTVRNFQVSVWLPAGPTNTAIPPAVNQIYTQRYFVYEVIFGNNRSFVDVVDTWAAGTGWVRLGNGGRPTNMVFPWDGFNPIRVRLYNTIPRGADGQLLETVSGTQPDNRFAVYADAVRAQADLGGYTASPTIAGFGDANARVTASTNTVSLGIRDDQFTPVTKGTVAQYNFTDGGVRWRYSPQEEGDQITYVDNNSAGVNVSGAFAASTLSGLFRGTNYLEAPIDSDAAATATVTYQPTLPEAGTYEVYAYIPGNANGEVFGSTRYDIYEGAALVFTGYVPQENSLGWFRIGRGRRFAHSDTSPLRLVISNQTNLPADIGKKSYADAVRFVGASNLAITSTPVQYRANIRKSVGGVPISTRVVLTCDERGRLHCLDWLGNGDITTTPYWTYPSTPDPDNASWTDPNQVAGLDGPGGIAQMPTGFDLSTAVIERIDGQDILFIAGTNGRIYSIDMAGRGDYDPIQRKPGTTTRRWTFPSDYPSTTVSSRLGPFRGSLAFATTTDGPTIFAGADQGRMYALDARGNTTTKVTTVRWRFPAQSDPALGRVVSTPAIAFGKVYFGTLARTDSGIGEFYALDIDDGSLVWSRNGHTGTSGFVPFDSFVSSPATISAALLNTRPPAVVSAADAVFALNENNYLYSFNAQTGEVLWATNELGTGADGGLTVTPMSVYNNVGIQVETFCVVFGARNSNFTAVFAEGTPTEPTGDLITNRFGTKLAWQQPTNSETIRASMAVGLTWMYGADARGYVYAWDNDNLNQGLGPISPNEEAPPAQTIIPNDPRGDIFRQGKIKLLTREGYRRLRLDTGATGHLTYPQATGPAFSFNRSPLAFEWGETAYILVYDFPFAIQNTSGNDVDPPIVNVQLSVEGKTVRAVAVGARQFTEPPNAPNNLTEPSLRNNGYAILAFPFQGGGPNSLPPGNGEISVSISTASLSSGTTNTQQNISLDPALSRLTFAMANPIGIAMLETTGAFMANAAMGLTINPSDPQALVNGSPDVTTTATINENRLGVTAGYVPHGQAKAAKVAVYDRSLMTLVRGEGRGLDNIRIERRDLAWQGKELSVFKPLDALLYPNFEDYPTEYPNVSLDYPDIRREQLRVIKDPNGTAENPVFNGVSLLAPLGPGGLADPVTEDNAGARQLRPTLFDIEVDVPRYQPANDLSLNIAARIRNSDDSVARFLDQGYFGRLSVFVDSSNNGALDTVGQREAYRSFNLSAAVPADERISVQTPSVDLGSLAVGTGYTSDSAGDPFSPWTGRFSDVFKTFRVFNEGNVNLLNVRLAKRTNQPAGAYSPWAIYSSANDNLAWLDGSFDLWSDIDQTFALANPANPTVRRAIVKKPRVEDRAPSELLTNPIRRANPNLNVAEGLLNPAGPPAAAPKVGVSIPIGFPSGKYVQTMRVIEDTVLADESLMVLPSGATQESFSDPTFELGFTVREARLTNSRTPRTGTMVDNLIPDGLTPSLAHSNVQPAAARDAAGNLVVLWASNRSNFAEPMLMEFDAALAPGGRKPNSDEVLSKNRWKIYAATLNGETPAGASGTSPLRELNSFSPDSASRWFRQATDGYPTTSPNVLFDLQAGETLIAGTDQYGSPSMPVKGFADPFNPGSSFNGAYVAFVGEAQKSTPSGTLTESRIFVTKTSANVGTGAVLTGDPVRLDHDPRLRKGKPAVVQLTNDLAILLYDVTGTGQSTVFWTAFDGTSVVADPAPLNFGRAFESVTSPSAYARTYFGANPAGAGNRILEVTFAGKLRGRPYPEIFSGRLNLGANNLLSDPDGNFAFLTERQEVLVADGGVYRARGVNWNRRANIRLEQEIDGVVTNLLADGTDVGFPNSRVDDRDTGLVTFTTKLGGKVYLDPSAGTVRFASATPARSAVLRLTYTPRFLRQSVGQAAGYSTPTAMFDDRFISDAGYWARPNGTGANLSDAIRSDRVILTYGRAAAGAGQASRPFMRTFRYGVNLPRVIHTQANGAVTGITVSGNLGPFQVDPANAKVYFSAQDEDRNVTITYTASDSNGNPEGSTTVVSRAVTQISETNEQPILIDQAVNESGLTAFLDPFDALAQRRPGLVWLFWTSTRGGAPDVYFQTIARRFTPLAVNP